MTVIRTRHVPESTLGKYWDLSSRYSTLDKSDEEHNDQKYIKYKHSVLMCEDVATRAENKHIVFSGGLFFLKPS